MLNTAESPNYPFARTLPLDPPEEYRVLRTERPVSRATLWDGSQVWLVTRFSDVRDVLSDARFSASPASQGFPFITPGVGAVKKQDGSFLRMDRPQHSEHRRMWTKYFSVKRIEEMRPDIQRIVDEALDAMIAQGPPADLVEAFALPVPSLFICRLLDVPYADHEFFQQHSRARASADATIEEITAANDALKQYWLDMIAERIERPGDDLISKLVIDEVIPGRLTHAELADAALIMLFAGHETTANMISLGTYTLLRNPGQLRRFQGNQALAPGLVDELLRYTSIVHLSLSRAALDDVEVGGQLIRRGEGVILVIPAANRDEQAFPRPDEFDIGRQSRHHLAFGYGMHQCIGAALARVELQIVFQRLFARLPGLRLAVPEEDLRFKTEALFYGPKSLPVRW